MVIISNYIIKTEFGDNSGRLGSSLTGSTKTIVMDKGKVIEAINKWFSANYEIKIDYSTMIMTIKKVKNHK